MVSTHIHHTHIRTSYHTSETTTVPVSTSESSTENAPITHAAPNIQLRSPRETGHIMICRVFLLLTFLSLSGAIKFQCKDKVCTEEIYTSLTPCTFTDIDDDGICICNDSCHTYKKKEGTCNTIKCVYTGTPKWHFWAYLIVSTFSGTIATFLFSKRSKI